MNDAPAYFRLHATGLTMLTEKEYSVYIGTTQRGLKKFILLVASNFSGGTKTLSATASDIYVFSAHLQYAHASVLLYTFMREIEKCGNVILGTRWN